MFYMHTFILYGDKKFVQCMSLLKQWSVNHSQIMDGPYSILLAKATADRH